MTMVTVDIMRDACADPVIAARILAATAPMTLMVAAWADSPDPLVVLFEHDPEIAIAWCNRLNALYRRPAIIHFFKATNTTTDQK
jgi:hypothetical protein